MHTSLSANFTAALEADPNYKIAMFYGGGEFDRTVGFTGNERQLNMLNTVANMAGFTIARVEGEEDLTASNFYGLGLDGTSVSDINNMQYVWKEFTAPDGIPYIEISVLKGADHVHFSGNAEIMWPFMAQFSRDPETHELIYTPNAE